MRSVTTRPLGHAANRPTRASWQDPLLAFACARWLELRSVMDRSRAIDRRRSQAAEPSRSAACCRNPAYHRER
jgi:hypothetical protein